MSFEYLIKDLEKKYPKLFVADKITISMVSFKKNLEYFYNQGKKEGDGEGYFRAESFYLNLNKNSKNSSDIDSLNIFKDIFKDMFGGKK